MKPAAHGSRANGAAYQAMGCDSCSRRRKFPPSGARGEELGMRGPVVEGGRVEVGTIGPDEGMNFGVNSHLIEKCEVAQRPEEFPREDGAKIDHLFRAVIEAHTQGISLHGLK